MTVIVVKDIDQIGECAGMLFAAQVLKKPDSVLGFATGSSPISTYKTMVGLYQKGLIDFSKVTTFNLDEYWGLAGAHEQSYRRFMMENLFDHINVPHDRIHVPNGVAPDADAECKAYEAAINAAGGIDLQILGIGHNGHIGFNEPGADFPDITHKVELTQSTIAANTRFFSSSADVPRFALSMGIGTIMRAKSIVMVANGAEKADTVSAMINGPVTPACPASVLQLYPKDVTVILDEAAASKLA